MATANEVMGVLEEASRTLTQNHINHMDYLTGDFWRIEVSTVGFNQYEVQTLENALHNLFEYNNIQVNFNGHCFVLGWYHKDIAVEADST